MSKLESIASNLVNLGVWIKDNHKPLIAAAGAIYACSKLHYFASPHHTVHYQLSHQDRTHPLDANLFPQYIKNAGGLYLYVRRWLVSRPKAYIFLCHGFNEHTGRYEHVAEAFNAAGYSVVGMDYQGHGQSDGDRGHVASFQHFIEDYMLFLEREQAWIVAGAGPYGSSPHHVDIHSGHKASGDVHHPSVPCYLFGHSMGGLMALSVALHTKNHPHVKPWSGVAVTSPALAIDPSVNTPFLNAIASVLSRLMPKLPVSTLPTGALSTIPEVEKRYVADPLVNANFVRARLGYEFISQIKTIQGKAKDFTLPLLVIHSDDDVITLPVGAHTFFNNASSTDKTLEVVKGMKHEVLNDWDRVRLMELIVHFFEKRL